MYCGSPSAESSSTLAPVGGIRLLKDLRRPPLGAIVRKAGPATRSPVNESDFAGQAKTTTTAKFQASRPHDPVALSTAFRGEARWKGSVAS